MMIRITFTIRTKIINNNDDNDDNAISTATTTPVTFYVSNHLFFPLKNLYT